MSGVFGDIEHVVQENVSMRTLTPTAVITQIALMAILSVIVLLFFNFLRPKYRNVYQPKMKYYVGRKQPPRITSSYFGWIPPLWHTDEQELLNKIGVDAVVYLRFVRMLRWLFTSMAVLAGGSLIPIDVMYNIQHVPSDSRDIFSMLTIRNVAGPFLFVHVGVAYAITFLAIGFMWWNWRRILELRRCWLTSPDYIDALHARTLMIQRVPPRYRTDQGIRRLLGLTKAESADIDIHISHKIGILPKATKYHNLAVCTLEERLVAYLKGDVLGTVRPTIRKGGFCGIGGRRIDAIDAWTEHVRLDRLEIMKERMEVARPDRKAESYGFASACTVAQAHELANRLKDSHPRGTIISLAPDPREIIWENLKISEATRAQKRTVGWVYLLFVCFLNTVPLFIVSFLANLAAVSRTPRNT